MKSTDSIQRKQEQEPNQVPAKYSASSIKTIFKVDPLIGVSKFRLNLLRFFYGINALFLGTLAWSEIFTHKTLWQPLPGVAFSFWAAFSVLAVLGLRHPLKMLPLLLMQFTYKLIWLIIVAYPLWSVNHLSGSSAQDLASINFKGVFVDLFIIPWPYVLRNYILKPKQSGNL
jgi:hypothetical protein